MAGEFSGKVAFVTGAAHGQGRATAIALAREGASTGRRALTGAWWGLLGLFVGLVVFWFLLNGLNGA